MVMSVGGGAVMDSASVDALRQDGKLVWLKAPAKGIIGPWEHRWPNVGRPGPRIDGYDDIGRWFDR